jgi:O-acetyl-ADP-ribose deacetylase (regulator of RNase III)
LEVSFFLSNFAVEKYLNMLTITIIKNSNIFNSKCQTLVNTVNCVGVMGKGLALEMKKRYPLLFEQYKTFCDKKLIDIGKLWIYKTDTDKLILNFPTKKHWKDSSEYDYIEQGMKKFVETYKNKNISSIAFPMLGCNNGGLNKDIVLEILTRHLIKCENLVVEIYY